MCHWEKYNFRRVLSNELCFSSRSFSLSLSLSLSFCCCHEHFCTEIPELYITFCIRSRGGKKGNILEMLSLLFHIQCVFAEKWTQFFQMKQWHSNWHTLWNDCVMSCCPITNVELVVCRRSGTTLLQFHFILIFKFHFSFSLWFFFFFLGGWKIYFSSSCYNNFLFFFFMGIKIYLKHFF